MLILFLLCLLFVAQATTPELPALTQPAAYESRATATTEPGAKGVPMDRVVND